MWNININLRVQICGLWKPGKVSEISPTWIRILTVETNP